MGCGTATIKYLLFIFNLIFALGGLAILAVGAIIQWNLNFYGTFFNEEVTIPSIILIVAGSAIFVISFFGCCGAVRESHCMIVTFAVLLLIVFVLQVIGGVLAFVYRSDVEAGLKTVMTDMQKLYTQESDQGTAARESWDSIQKEFHCCGVDKYTEWTLIVGIPAPESCKCEPNTSEPCEAGVYSEGCYPKLRDFVKMSEIVLGAIAIGVALIELMGVIFALTLANAIKNQGL